MQAMAGGFEQVHKGFPRKGPHLHVQKVRTGPLCLSIWPSFAMACIETEVLPKQHK